MVGVKFVVSLVLFECFWFIKGLVMVIIVVSVVLILMRNMMGLCYIS